MKKLFFILSILSLTALMGNAQVDAAKTVAKDAPAKVENAMDQLTPGEKAAAADPNISVKTCQHSGKQGFYRKNADGTTTVMQYDVERKALVPVLDKDGKEVTYAAKKSCSKAGKACCKGGKTCAKGSKTCSKGAKTCSKGGKACCKGGKKACCKGAKTCTKGAKTKDAAPTSQPGMGNKS